MSSKGATKRKRSPTPNATAAGTAGAAAAGDPNAIKPAGYILECDAPVKQFVQYNDSTRHDDKKWIIADLDETHLLIRRKYKNEIVRKVEDWMDSNVFSSVEKVGEDLDVS
jgi:Transcription factor TFIIH complex subunit Tfb5